jgi:hypothetical protein
VLAVLIKKQLFTAGGDSCATAHILYRQVRVRWLLRPFGSDAHGVLHDLIEEKTMSEPSYDELKAKIAELEKQAQGRGRGVLQYKVSEKGGVSVYGLGRFPVTLYYEQWIRLLDQADQIREFLEENKSQLKMKNAEG